MLRRLLAASRYIMIVPVVGTLLGSFALILYEIVVLTASIYEILVEGAISTKAVKVFAVGIVEAVDVFLIGIAVYITGIGLYFLFVDETLPLPKWLRLNSFEDLKANLISVVIAVLAVLFLREAVAWDGNADIAAFGVSLALVIAALSLYLFKTNSR
ncbi:YqhA family protein [Rhizobiaceae bacterium n13]|uniref:YqhA family protein n=1 Tax=Ferirhizobium litorale TaxID=2927786 RepID=A0AAE3QEY6_9HYPH|nr:YqhA family protein [Fererhizobium litorale]MDI7861709.1 YqhA family protein [Fererhizobium litorale]MDI7921949.1 YqhA family protein [Fererhizobium litorale]